MIITIDGPAGAGKGTLAQNLVKKYHFRYLDTGALFRAVALCLINDQTLNDENFELKAEFYSKNMDFKFTKYFCIILNGEDVTDKIRDPEVGAMASKIATIAQVRINLDDFQRTFANMYKAKGVILDGRDIGTFIAPDAPVKVFLDCDAELRAARRVEQLEDIGKPAKYDDILKNIIQRDLTDRTREVRPMIPANDAIIIDTGENSISDVVTIVSKKIDPLIIKKDIATKKITAKEDSSDIVKIRKAKDEDLERLFQIHKATMENMNYVSCMHDALNNWLQQNTNNIERLVKSEHLYTVVAEINDIIVGFGTTIQRETNLLYVHPDYQGNGIATKLLTTLEEALGTPVEFKVSKNAVEFYRRNGYKIQGKVDVSYHGKSLDLFIACK